MNTHILEVSQTIAQMRASGLGDEMIAKLLQTKGWSEESVNLGFIKLYEDQSGHPLPEATSGRGENAKDAFLYLISFFSLAAWISAVGGLIFDFINKFVPDKTSYSGNSVSLDAFSGFWYNMEIASIVVAFPIYIGVMYLLNKDIISHPEKLESPVRKWLIYLVIFITSAVMIGDLIAVIFWLLDGSYIANTFLKLATLFVLAGGTFVYYWFTVRTGVSTNTPIQNNDAKQS